MNRSRVSLAFLLITLACFALSPTARATCQDACLTNGNTVQGDDALINNTTGLNNTAIGSNALFSNTTGGANAAIGAFALNNNTTGNTNTALGVSALSLNTIGGQNVAIGPAALFTNTTGADNTAIGYDALVFNTTGSRNTANGEDALERNTTGSTNTAVGESALGKNTTGNNNIAIGNGAGIKLTTGSNNIDIFNPGVAREANTIRIGTTGTQTATFIAGINGATVPTGVAVIVDTDGHLGTTTSSARFKEAIKPMDKASEVILALKPVTFRYKKELDPASIPQFGLVAEQVEKVNPDLVARDKDGKPYSVRYEAVNAMLLNEFLKEHRKVEEQARLNREQQAALEEQTREIQALTATVKKQAALIQKVSDRLDQRLSKKTLVADNQ